MDSPLLPHPNDDLGHYLQLMVAHGASDLFLSSGSAAALKIQGVVRRLPEAALDATHTQRLAYSVMREAQIRAFESTLECDLAIALPGLGRFRVNVYRQRGDVAVVVRHINAKIPSLEQLKLPPVLRQLALLKRGLVLVVGAAGSGKSTTLAAMLDHRNHNAAGHILTVEDPMEFEHGHGTCIVDQREVGLDTQSFDEALRHAIGGVLETMPASMAFLCPNVNSYRRFGAQFYVPNAPSWGLDNRTVALRVPTGSPDAVRIEHRVAGADANPYLMMAAVLAGVHHGLTNKIEPGEPIEGNSYEQLEQSLPNNLRDALRELDDVGRVVLDEEVPVELLAVEQHRLGGPRPQDAVLVALHPAPELIEGQRRRHRREPLRGGGHGPALIAQESGLVESSR